MDHSFSTLDWRDFIHVCATSAENENRRVRLQDELSQGPVSGPRKRMAVDGAQAATRRLSMRKRASALAPAWGWCARRDQNELFLELTDAAAEGLRAPERAILLTDALISAATVANAGLCEALLEKGAKNKADEHYRSFFDPMGCLWRSRESDEKTEACTRVLSATLDASLRFSGSEWTHLTLAGLGPVFRPRAMEALLQAVPEQLTLLDAAGRTPLQEVLERADAAFFEAASWLADRMSEDAVNEAFAAAARKIQIELWARGSDSDDANRAIIERLAQWGASREVLALSAAVKGVQAGHSQEVWAAPSPARPPSHRL